MYSNDGRSRRWSAATAAARASPDVAAKQQATATSVTGRQDRPLASTIASSGAGPAFDKPGLVRTTSTGTVGSSGTGASAERPADTMSVGSDASRQSVATNPQVAGAGTTSNSSTTTTAGAAKKRRNSQTVHPYFRWLGPTAIAPPASGTFRLLSVNIKTETPVQERRAVTVRRANPGDNIEIPEDGQWTPEGAHTPANNNNNNNPGTPGLAQAVAQAVGQQSSASRTPVDAASVPLPHPSLLRHFAQYASNYVPYMPYTEFDRRLHEGVVGESLQFAMGAIALRDVMAQKLPALTDEAAAAMARQCEAYTENAKRLLVPHLSSPSVEVVFVALLVAYNEFAEDRDSGLWVWLGIALRMAIDLGLHKAPDPDRADDAECRYGQNVFWASVCLDRLICCGTGRATTISDTIIEHIPDLRFLPTAADGSSTTTASQQQRPDPFPYFCRLMILLGRVSDCLNSYAARHDDAPSSIAQSVSNMSPATSDLIEKFQHFQTEVSDFYTSLPADLLFDVTNFQEYARIGYGQVFLQLHVWNQALIMAVYHPSLVYPKLKIDVAGLVANPHAEMTGTGAISIADMVAFADLVDPMSFLGSPFLSQPIYMAACAVLSVWHSLKTPAPTYPVFTLQRTYNTCRQILARMQRVWNGISWHQRTLDSLAAFEPDVDLSVDPRGSIITKDLGVVRKALADEATKRWLANEITGADNPDDVFGLFVAGAIDRSNQMSQPSASPVSASPPRLASTSLQRSPTQQSVHPPAHGQAQVAAQAAQTAAQASRAGSGAPAYEHTQAQAQAPSSAGLSASPDIQPIAAKLDYALPPRADMSPLAPAVPPAQSFRDILERGLSIEEILGMNPLH